MLKAIAAAFAVCVAALSAQAQPLTKINISMQGPGYSAVPIFLANQKGWWKEAGLDPSFVIFASGPPQIAAVAAKTWDVGLIGSPPGVLGAARFNIVTIGVADDQSATNVLMARAADATAIKANPATALKGQQVLITVNTTVDYVLQSCLKKWGLTRDDSQVVNLAQPQILSAASTGEGRLMGLWAPNNYLAEEKIQLVPVCTGQDAGVVVPGNVVVRDDYLKDHPDTAARYLAVMLRGFAWMKANRQETLRAMDQFYKEGGSFVSEHGLNAELDRRPVFGLDEQTALFDRSHGPSRADGWYDSLANYLVASGAIDKSPDVKTYLSDVALKHILADPKLSAFARNQ